MLVNNVPLHDTNQNNFLLNQDILPMMAILVFLRTGADYDIIGAWGWQPHPVKKKRIHHTCFRSEHVLIQRHESIAVHGFCSLLLLNDDDNDDGDDDDNDDDDDD